MKIYGPQVKSIDLLLEELKNAPGNNRNHRRLLSPDDPRHGTTNGYSNYKCRCDKCTKAHSLYYNELRQRSPEYRAAQARAQTKYYERKKARREAEAAK